MMESGHVHLDDRIRGIYCFYFTLDPDSPTAPVPNRVKRFCVGTSTESYAEAFFGLVRHLNREKLNAGALSSSSAATSESGLLPSPPSANVSTIGDISLVKKEANEHNQDASGATMIASGGVTTTHEILRPWCHLYSAAFGPLAFETFCRRVMNSDSTFLFCELNEEEARIKAAKFANPAGASWGQTSTRAVSPPRASAPTNYLRQNTELAQRSTPLPIPGQVSPNRNGSRLHGLVNSPYLRSSQQQQQQQQDHSGVAGHASSRLSAYTGGGLGLSQTGGATSSAAAAGGGDGTSRRSSFGDGGNNNNLNTSSSSAGGTATIGYTSRTATASALASSNAILDSQRQAEHEHQVSKLRNEADSQASQLMLERSRAVVQNLSDAERSALIYKYDNARKELEEERKRSSNLRETLRITMQDFEERLERLQQSSANSLAEAAARERHNLDTIDKELTQKFKQERDQLELNLLERDRKLAKALARVEFLEGQCDALQKKSDLLATEEQRAAAFCIKSKAEQERLEDENNRLRRSLASVEARLDEETRTRRNTEVAYKSLENHSSAVKGENEQLRRDCQKFAQYSLGLHEELKQLDSNAIAAAEMFGPRFNNNNNNNNNNYRGGGGAAQRRTPPPAAMHQYSQQQGRY